MSEAVQAGLAVVTLSVSVVGACLSGLVAWLLLERRTKEAAAREQEAQTRALAASAAVEAKLGDVLVLVNDLRQRESRP